MPPVVSREDWLKARIELLSEEKEFTRARDALSAKRQELPWVEVHEDYTFEGRDGAIKLSAHKKKKNQLIIYHFMFGEDWSEGCSSCSFWADNFNNITPHLAARDAAFAVVSHAPYEKLAAYQKRMGWGFNWLSANNNSFNQDFHVTFSKEEFENGTAIYNFTKSTFPSTEAPGVSIFARNGTGKIYHTYSTYGRGIDMLNGTYHYLDLLPKGRDEEGLDYSQAWIRRHDEY